MPAAYARLIKQFPGNPVSFGGYADAVTRVLSRRRQLQGRERRRIVGRPPALVRDVPIERRPLPRRAPHRQDQRIHRFRRHLLSERGPGRPRGGATSGKAKRTRSGRLARRSPEDIAQVLAQVVGLVKRSKAGMRSEEIRKALKLDVREVPRVLREGLAKKALKSKGQKRATVYSVR